MAPEVARPDHHADFAQGVVVRVLPGVPHDAVGAQRPSTFGAVAASLQDQEVDCHNLNRTHCSFICYRYYRFFFLCRLYPVVDAVQVGVEALVVPPAAVGDLGADVAAVRGAEALLVVVPAEGVLHGAAEARDVQAVLVLLVLHAAHIETQANAYQVS